jgi:hypothetical protein
MSVWVSDFCCVLVYMAEIGKLARIKVNACFAVKTLMIKFTLQLLYNNHSHDLLLSLAICLFFPRASHSSKLGQKLFISLKANLGQHVFELVLQLNSLLVQIIDLLLQQFVFFERAAMLLE